MNAGRLVAVVGPSGVGKDSVIAGIVAAAPRISPVRRVITRPADAGGEDHDTMTEEEFTLNAAKGAFCLHWAAHGLRYGIPAEVLADVQRGEDCIVNLSRTALLHAQEVFPRICVLHITASAEVLAQRLAARGRESAAEIATRLAQATKPLPPGIAAVTIVNDGPLAETVAQALAALHPVRA